MIIDQKIKPSGRFQKKMNEKRLVGIENELHNLNLNILELIKTIKEQEKVVMALPADPPPPVNTKKELSGYDPFLDEYV